MFTIVDMVFTGPNPQRDRLVALAMANYDGKHLGEVWEQLLNPQVNLSPLEASFFHIDLVAIENGLFFADVAKQILDFTEGRILVGLQVRLLYSLLLGEFRRTTYRFQRRQICLSKLITQHFGVRRAQSVTAVCGHFNIPFSSNYTLGERLPALAAIFERLFIPTLRDGLDKKQVRQTATNSKFPPQLPPERIENLPHAVGVYYFMGRRGEILYLGKSTDIKKRVLQHFSADVHTKGKPALTSQVYDLQYHLTGSELIALLLESDEIKRFMPAHNRAQRRLRYTYAVYVYRNSDGYLCLLPALLQPEDVIAEKKWTLVQKFAAQWTAVSWIFYVIGQYSLRIDLCGVLAFTAWLEKAGYTETDFGFGKYGDTPDIYNKRIQLLIANYSYPDADMLIVDKGRSAGEKSVVLIENNKYAGYAYLPKENASDWDTVRKMLIPFRENPDIQRIIRTYIEKNKVKLEIVVKNRLNE